MNNLTSDSEDTESSDAEYKNNEIKFSIKKIPKGNLTWNDSQEYVLFLPDPLTNTPLLKSQFIDLYGIILNYLDGKDLSSYFTFFFKPDIIDTTTWIFVDEDAREDFTDWCIEENLLPTLKEAHQGEDDIDLEALEKEAYEIEKKEIAEREKSILIQKEKQKNKKNVQKSKKELLEIQLTKLQQDLQNTEYLEKKEKIKKKIEKVMIMLTT